MKKLVYKFTKRTKPRILNQLHHIGTQLWKNKAQCSGKFVQLALQQLDIDKFFIVIIAKQFF